MRSRKRFAPWAAPLLGVMLFAQAAMAWSACDWLGNSPAEAVLAAAAASAPCHRSGAAPACLPHCLSDRQVVHQGVLDIPAPPVEPMAVTKFFEARVTALERPAESGAPIATGPPRRILLQSFQI